MESKRQAAKSFRDLIVWQKAHELVLDVYQATQSFPKEEMYALTSQIRRSTMSVAANIAEGFKKTSSRDKIRIYNIAQGSLSETEYFLLLSQDLRYGDMKELLGKADEVGRILGSYIRAVKS
ncbi:MAG: four helix bundle protein [Cyclobacteriaceae bacterium]|nr:four helix bundle protein [Cyclobacteriaceae bacterium]